MKISIPFAVRCAGFVAAVASSILAGSIGASSAAQRPGGGREGGEYNGESQQQMRLREGTPLDATGSFKITAERAIFTTEDGARFSGLENLNLERVAIAVSESPDQLVWNVSGTVTEFRGANYLLITRAMLKGKPNSVAKPGADGFKTLAPPDKEKPVN